MIKILHVGEYVQGGLATYMTTLLKGMDNSCFENYLFMSEYNSNHNWPLPKCRISYYNYHRSLFCLIPAMIKMIKTVKHLKPDIIYCYSSWGGVIGRLPFFLYRKDCKIVYNAHGWSFLRDTENIKKKLYALVERFLSKKTDCIINVSKYEFEAARLYGVDEEKMTVVYNGIDDEESNKYKLMMNKEEINLLFVGRFDPQKGVDYLLDVMREIKNDKIHLYLIGDSVVSRDTIKKNDISNVTFLGWISHNKLRDYYSSCDAVIMPSRWEAFGLVAIEAMKYGKPVIASNRGALPELIEDGKNGYLFDFEKRESLIDLLNNLSKKVLVQKKDYTRDVFSKNYTSARMIEETTKIFLSL